MQCFVNKLFGVGTVRDYMGDLFMPFFASFLICLFLWHLFLLGFVAGRLREGWGEVGSRF
jgi:hypothetical protein